MGRSVLLAGSGRLNSSTVSYARPSEFRVSPLARPPVGERRAACHSVVGYSTRRSLLVISRRTFLQRVITGAALPSFKEQLTLPTAGEVLYNGIALGQPWPPRLRFLNERPIRPPYLVDPPSVIPIDVGRQLFVDDFLIQDTTLTRASHRPTYHSASPVLRPDQPWEQRDDVADRTQAKPNPAAMVFSDGVFFDPRDRLFKIWYMGGYGRATCHAISDNGINWRKPAFDVEAGTNVVDQRNRDSGTVWLDQFERDERHRYKMSLWRDHALVLLTSPDGVHWRDIGQTGRTGDRSTFFYNPFRGVWGFSLRADQGVAPISLRYRQYWESPTFAGSGNWAAYAPVSWIKADSADYALEQFNVRPELYNLDCVAYESVMLGLFAIWRGESGDREKINEVTVGFSRDGFHWERPDRRPFLPVGERQGQWNFANVQSAGGGCLIVGDSLYFYASGRQGVPGSNAPGICSTGLATLRRDGFASMDWLPDDRSVIRRRTSGASGFLTTRPIRFSGAHLFVNADLGEGELRVEVLDETGRVVEPFSLPNCRPVTGDGTKLRVEWASAALGTLAGRTLRFRFSLTHGRFYAFWVSPWLTGESRGYPAAGGPEFRGPIDRSNG